ncbi:single-stranded DNA-binding protein [Rhizobium sp. NXC24]|uniref:single-stranded DNA-binding protein n=1 Tax=Rhizobium sp. NXC24 TaxID=2048897 RepID=UPI000CDF5388|nr:single-stranded DNA-binding protein [Rhizobium sp. NXC24]AVA23910.1 single-stranded DNA-binding protein [Rhizobium sp. NXC24]
MGTTNQLTLRGNVGQEPRQIGKTVKLSVATDRSWVDSEGQRKSVSDWVTVTFFEGKMADFVLRHVHKGDKVLVQARVSESSYQKDGLTHYTTDVIAEDIDIFVPGSTSRDQ